MRVLVTRPQADQAQTLSALSTMGITGLSCPALEIEWLDYDLPNLQWQGTIFTSRNGLRALSNSEISILRDVPLYAVGRKTEMLAQKLGFSKVYPASPDADQLSQSRLTHFIPDDGPVLYFTARHRSGNLVEELENRSIPLHVIEAYQTVSVEDWPSDIVDDIQSGQIDGVLLYSARTAKLFAAQLERYGLDKAATKLTFFCLSPAVASVLSERDYPLVVAEAPNEASLLASVGNAHNY